MLQDPPAPPAAPRGPGGTHAGSGLVELQADGSAVPLLSGTVAPDGGEGTLQGRTHNGGGNAPLGPGGQPSTPPASPSSPRGCPCPCAGLWWQLALQRWPQGWSRSPWGPRCPRCPGAVSGGSGLWRPPGSRAAPGRSPGVPWGPGWAGGCSSSAQSALLRSGWWPRSQMWLQLGGNAERRSQEKAQSPSAAHGDKDNIDVSQPAALAASGSPGTLSSPGPAAWLSHTAQWGTMGSSPWPRCHRPPPGIAPNPSLAPRLPGEALTPNSTRERLPERSHPLRALQSLSWASHHGITGLKGA